MNAATVLLEIILFSAFRKGGAVQMDSNYHFFNPASSLWTYRRGLGFVERTQFHLVFMIRGQIDWSPFVFKVIQQG